MRYPVRAVSPHPPWDFSSFAPPGVDIIKNMMMARLHKGPSALTLHWFYHQVRLRGPWDYKNTINKCYENFGNFNYGATGTAAGIPAEILLRAAGWRRDGPVIQMKRNLVYGTTDPLLVMILRIRHG